MSWREQLDVGGLTVHDDNKTTANVGVPVGGVVTVEELGNARHHLTKLTLNTAMPAIAGGAALAVGKLLYTLPSGICVINSAYISLALDEVDGNVTADTPDGGLGTVIGSGVVNVLGGTPTFENILTGQTFNDCNGTVENAGANGGLVVDAADAHTVYLNIADTWAASGEAAMPVTGIVILDWTFLGA